MQNDNAPTHTPPGGQAHEEQPPVRTAPLALWAIARAFLLTLHTLFGAPEHVAASHTLTAKAHRLMASWLRCAEAMLRRLLLIEASALPKPNTRPLLHAHRPRARKAMSFTADQPEKWRVSFRMFASPARRRAQHDAAGDAARLARIGLRLSTSTRPPRAFVYREEQSLPAPDEHRIHYRRGRRAERRAPMLRQDREWVRHEAKLRFHSAWALAERYEALLRVFNDPAPYARRLSRRLHATPHRLIEALHAPPEARSRVESFEALGEQARATWRPHFSSG